MNTVITVRDFSHIWEAYTTFEDNLVAAKMDMLGDQETIQADDLDVDLEEETAGLCSRKVRGNLKLTKLSRF